MFKTIIKWICPSGKTLAGYAAEGIAKSVNGTNEDVRLNVAKYAEYAHEVSEIAEKLSAMALDGKICENETKELKEMIAPIFNKVLELV